MKTIYRKLKTPILSLALMSFFAPTSWAEGTSFANASTYDDTNAMYTIGTTEGTGIYNYSFKAYNSEGELTTYYLTTPDFAALVGDETFTTVNEKTSITSGGNYYDSGYTASNGNAQGGLLYYGGDTFTLEKFNIVGTTYLPRSGYTNLYGGAVAIGTNATVKSYSGDFIGNSIQDASESKLVNAYGGALSNRNNIQGNVVSNFISNYIYASTGSGYGGALYNEKVIGKTNEGSISGDFILNYISAGSIAYGGAIYNSGEGTIYAIEGNIISNYVTSTNNTALGGAVYNAGILSFRASDDASTGTGSTYYYIGNYAGDSAENGGFLYQTEGSSTTFNTDENSNIVIGYTASDIEKNGFGDYYDSIAGEAGSSITKEGEGTLTVNSSMEYYEGELNVQAGIMEYTNSAALGASVLNIGTSTELSKTTSIATFEANANSLGANTNIYGNGTLSLTGGTISSSITNSGTISIAGAVTTNVAISGNISIAESASLAIANSVTMTWSDIDLSVNVDSSIKDTAIVLISGISSDYSNYSDLNLKSFVAYDENGDILDSANYTISIDENGNLTIVLKDDSGTVDPDPTPDPDGDGDSTATTKYYKWTTNELSGGLVLVEVESPANEEDYDFSLSYDSDIADEKLGDITEDISKNFLNLQTTTATNGAAINNTSTEGATVTGDFVNNGIYYDSTANTTTGTLAGGAVYNSGTLIIDGDFTGNYVQNNPDNNSVSGTRAKYTEGGAIYNATGATLTLSGDFISNYVFTSTNVTGSSTATARSYGGAIYNAGTIRDIVGDFVSNYTYAYTATGTGTKYERSYSSGGAIYNAASSEITSITGDFSSNYTEARAQANASTTAVDVAMAQGGAIYNAGTITDITGDFITNYAYAYGAGAPRDGVTYTAQGGALYNSSTTSLNIAGDFSGNYTSSNSTAAATSTSVASKIVAKSQGGAIYNTSTASLSIAGDFISNYAFSSSAVTTLNKTGATVVATSQGGAVYNASTASLSIAGDFISNYTSATSTLKEALDGLTITLTSQGGAVYNAGDALTVEGNIKDNYAQSSAALDENNTATVQGGAVYNTGDITFAATNGESYEYSGNFATTSAADVDGVYAPVDGDDANGGFLYQEEGGSTTFSVDTDSKITIGTGAANYDSIAGYGSITKEGEGTLTVNSSMEYYEGELNVQAGIMEYTNSAALGASVLNIGTSTELSKTISIATFEANASYLGANTNIYGNGTLSLTGGTLSSTITNSGTISIAGAVATNVAISGNISIAESASLAIANSVEMAWGEIDLSVSVNSSIKDSAIVLITGISANYSNYSDLNLKSFVAYDENGNTLDSDDYTLSLDKNGNLTIVLKDDDDSGTVDPNPNPNPDPDPDGGDGNGDDSDSTVPNGDDEAEHVVGSDSDAIKGTIEATYNSETKEGKEVAIKTTIGTVTFEDGAEVSATITNENGDFIGYGTAITNEHEEGEESNGLNLVLKGDLTVTGNIVANSPFILSAASYIENGEVKTYDGVLDLTGNITTNTGGDEYIIIADATLNIEGDITAGAGDITLANGELNATNSTITTTGSISLVGSDLSLSDSTLVGVSGIYMTTDSEGTMSSISVSNSDLGETEVTIVGSASMLVGSVYDNAISGVDKDDLNYNYGDFTLDGTNLKVDSLSYFTETASNLNESALGSALDAIESTGDTDKDKLLIAGKLEAAAQGLDSFIMNNNSNISETNSILLNNLNFANVNRARNLLQKAKGYSLLIDGYNPNEAEYIKTAQSNKLSQVSTVAQLQSINLLGSKEASNGVAGYDYWSVGSTANIDQVLSEKAILGLSLGGVYSKTKGDAGDIASSTAFLVNAYSVINPIENLDVFANLGYSHFWNKGSKNSASAEWESDAINALFGLSYDLKTTLDGFTISPVAMMNMVYLLNDSASYSNGIDIDSQSYFSAKLILGLDLEYIITKNFAMNIMAMYSVEFADSSFDYTYSLSNSTNTLNNIAYSGSDLSQGNGILGIAFSYDFSDTCTAYFDYTSYIYEKLITHSLNLSIAFKF